MGPTDEPAVRRHLLWYRVAAAGLVLLGFVVAAFAVADMFEARRFERRAMPARAEVVRTHTDEFGDCTQVDVRFVTGSGHEIRTRIGVYDCSALRAGGTVPLSYDPNAPEDARIDPSDAWFGLLLAPTIAALGLIPRYLGRRARRRIERLATMSGATRMMPALTWFASKGAGEAAWISVFEGATDHEPPVASYRFFPPEGVIIPASLVGEVTGDLTDVFIVRDGATTYWPRGRAVRRERSRPARDRASARAAIEEISDELAGIERPVLHERDPGWRPALRDLGRFFRPGRPAGPQISHLETIRAWYLGSMVSWIFAPLQFIEGGLRLSRPRPTVQLAVGVAGAFGLAIGAVIRRLPLRVDDGRTLAENYHVRVMFRLGTCYLPAVALAIAFFTDRVDFASLVIGVASWALAFRLAAPTARDIGDMQARLDAENVPLSLLTELLRRPPALPE